MNRVETLTTVKSNSINESLGIAPERVDEIETAFEEIGENPGEEGDDTSITGIMKKVVEKIKPNAPELLFIGFNFGQIVQRAEMHRQMMKAGPLGMLSELLSGGDDQCDDCENKESCKESC